MISVLMYHQIDTVPPEHDPYRLAVTPDLFARQMTYLHTNGYRCLSLAEAVNCWQRREREPAKCFVLTFDDGYRDIFTTVYPILCQFGFTASVFLVTGQVGDESQWEGQTRYPLLSWDEVRLLHQNGFTFGSHTLSHRRLSSLPDHEACTELQESRAAIGQALKTSIDFLSYPYGDFDARIQDIAAACGYQAACGVSRGDWGLFNVWRATCSGSDPFLAYQTKARGWYRYKFQARQNRLIGRPLRRIKRALFRS